MEQKTTGMYSPFNIGNLTVKNRLVRGATFEFGAEDWKITPKIVEFYRRLAQGGSGIIVTGMMAVDAGARSGPVMVETTYAGFADDIRQIADAVHV